MLKKLFSIFAALTLGAGLWAGNTITYTATSKLSETTDKYKAGIYTGAFTVSISAHTFSNGTGTITFSGDITTIGEYAFGYSTALTSLTIPDGVTSIGTYAFRQCTGCTSITIPESVTSIETNAFCSCTGLTSLTIPDGVTSIGKDAFKDVKNIIYHGSATGSPWGAKAVNGYVEGDFIYTDNTKTTLFLYIGKGGDVNIPETVTSIKENAFYSSQVTSVTIPTSVTLIEANAFLNCTKLTSINVDAGNTHYISTDGVLFNYAKDTLIQYPRGNNRTSYTIPTGVTTIGYNAFRQCTNLTSITIPDGITEIGERAFMDCSSLTSVTIPNSVTTIGQYAFYQCFNSTSITFGNNSQLTTIGNYAFWHCSKLDSITIPKSVTTIGNDAFAFCSALDSVMFGNNSQLTTIENYAFSNCTTLTSITIPASVTSIGSSAFRSSTLLTDMYLVGENVANPTITNNPFDSPAGAKLHVQSQAVADAITSTTTPNNWNSFICSEQEPEAGKFILVVDAKQPIKPVQPAEHGTPQEWKLTDTWEGETVPTKDDDVVIEDNYIVVGGGSSDPTNAEALNITISTTSSIRVKTGSSLVIGNLTIDESKEGTAQVIVESGGKLNVGSIEDASDLNIVLEDDGEHGTGVLLFDPETPMEETPVQATVELRLPHAHYGENLYHYSYIGIPLKLNAGDFTQSNWERTPIENEEPILTAFRQWNESLGWEDASISNLVPFKGFAITNQSTHGVKYRFKGNLVGNADQELHFNKNGYNFFANSYTAPIDIETLLTSLVESDKVNATIYMFDEKETVQSVSVGDVDGYTTPKFSAIPVMQGFFILNKTNDTPTEMVDYGDAVYANNNPNSPIYYAPTREAADFSRVHITMIGESGEDDAMYLIESDDFTPEFDNGYDVVKFINAGKINLFATTAHERQSSVFTNNLNGIVLGFIANSKDVNYTLSFDELQGKVYELTDLVTGTTTLLDGTKTYAFTAEAGSTIDNRFVIYRASQTPTRMKQVVTNGVSGVYTIMGQPIGTMTDWNKLPQGVYIVNKVKVVK